MIEVLVLIIMKVYHGVMVFMGMKLIFYLVNRSTTTLINEFVASLPTKNYATNRTDAYYKDDTWSIHLLERSDYGS